MSNTVKVASFFKFHGVGTPTYAIKSEDIKRIVQEKDIKNADDYVTILSNSGAGIDIEDFIFLEYQANTDGAVSGLYFDFDIYTKKSPPDNAVNQDQLRKFCIKLFLFIRKLVSPIEKDVNIQALSLFVDKPENIEEANFVYYCFRNKITLGTDGYRNGFHIYMPTVMLEGYQRKDIFLKIRKELGNKKSSLYDILSSITGEEEVDRFFDIKTSSNASYLLGSRLFINSTVQDIEDSRPKYLNYKCLSFLETGGKQLSIQRSYGNKLKQKEVGDMLIFDYDYNVIKEGYSNSIIKKDAINFIRADMSLRCTDDRVCSIKKNRYNVNYTLDKPKTLVIEEDLCNFEDIYEDSEPIDDMKDIMGIVDSLPEKYYTDFFLWRRILMAIASIGIDRKKENVARLVAMHFSKKWEFYGIKNKNNNEDFNRNWLSFINLIKAKYENANDIRVGANIAFFSLLKILRNENIEAYKSVSTDKIYNIIQSFSRKEIYKTILKKGEKVFLRKDISEIITSIFNFFFVKGKAGSMSEWFFFNTKYQKWESLGLCEKQKLPSEMVNYIDKFIIGIFQHVAEVSNIEVADSKTILWDLYEKEVVKVVEVNDEEEDEELENNEEGGMGINIIKRNRVEKQVVYQNINELLNAYAKRFEKKIECAHNVEFIKRNADKFLMYSDSEIVKNLIHETFIKTDSTSSYGDRVSSLVLQEWDLDKRAEFADKHRYLKGVSNGILETQGMLRPKLHKGYTHEIVTQSLCAKYDPSITLEAKECKDILAFLRNLFIDKDHDAFEFMMYTIALAVLDGSHKDDMVVVLYGLGGDGKSTLVNLVRALLGPYIYSTNASAISSRNAQASAGGARVDLLKLKGKSIVVYQEAEESLTIGTSELKNITGNDNISARTLYSENLQDFKFDGVVMITTNNKLNFTDNTSNAMPRRLRYIHFKKKFVEKYKYQEAIKNGEDPEIINMIDNSSESWKSDPKMLSAFLTVLIFFYRKMIFKMVEKDLDNASRVINGEKKYIFNKLDSIFSMKNTDVFNNIRVENEFIRFPTIRENTDIFVTGINPILGTLSKCYTFYGEIGKEYELNTSQSDVKHFICFNEIGNIVHTYHTDDGMVAKCSACLAERCEYLPSDFRNSLTFETFTEIANSRNQKERGIKSNITFSQVKEPLSKYVIRESDTEEIVEGSLVNLFFVDTSKITVNRRVREFCEKNHKLFKHVSVVMKNQISNRKAKTFAEFYLEAIDDEANINSICDRYYTHKYKDVPIENLLVEENTIDFYFTPMKSKIHKEISVIEDEQEESDSVVVDDVHDNEESTEEEFI